jgi:hypothetical protein
VSAFITIDPDLRIFDVTKVPVDGLSRLDAQVDIYSDLKEDWFSTPALQGQKFPFRTFGDLKSPTQQIGPYIFFDNGSGWRFRTYDEDYELTIDGNLVPEDVTKPVWIANPGRTVQILAEQSAQALTVSGDSLNISEIHGGVEREIWLDTSLVANGNGYQQSPYNNLTDAIDYGEANGITSLVVLDDITLDRPLKNFIVRGIGVPSVDLAGFDMKGSEFHRVKITGNYTNPIIVQESVLLPGMFLNGNFEKCAMAGDMFCVPGGSVFMTNNGSGIAGLGRPTITMSDGGARVLLSIRDNNGGMTIKGCTHADDEVTVEVNRGSLTFDASCTNGAMVARTAGKFVDATTGATVTREVYSMETWQRRGNDPENPLTTHEDGSVEVGDIDIDANTTGVSPNRQTVQTRQ